MKFLSAVTLLVTGPLAAIAASVRAGDTIVDIAIATPSLSTLVAAVVAGDLVDTLSSPGPFTVFAPNNAAFGALPPGALNDLLKPQNKPILQDLLTYHVVAGNVTASQISDGDKFTTVEGKQLIAEIIGGRVFIGGCQVIQPNNFASNGVVHIVNEVLTVPETIVDVAVATPSLSTLVAALTAGDLVSTLQGPGPFTVFAPENKAFEQLPAGVLNDLLKPQNKGKLVDLLTYHVVAGAVTSDQLFNGEVIQTIEGANVTVAINRNGVFINDAQVQIADATAPNGVIHVISKVLTSRP